MEVPENAFPVLRGGEKVPTITGPAGIESTIAHAISTVGMYLRDWICRVWPCSLRATPFVSMSKITTVPST